MLCASMRFRDFRLFCTPFSCRDMVAAVHEQAERLNRRIYVIAESDLNDVRSFASAYSWVVMDWTPNGTTISIMPCTHAAYRGANGYYEDFGRLQDLAKAFAEGFVFQARIPRRAGVDTGIAPKTWPRTGFVVCAQNHDQVGNRSERRSAQRPGLLRRAEAGCCGGAPFAFYTPAVYG